MSTDANKRLIRRFFEQLDNGNFGIFDDTGPWTGAVPLTTIDNPEGVLEYACHEGNYAIVGALSSALARDAK